LTRRNLTTEGGESVSKMGVFVAVVRRSAPAVIEASLVPTALFYTCLIFAGLGAAYVAALVWVYAAALSRLVRRRPVPPLLVLASVGITVRTTVAILQGSSFIYFAQPVVGSMVVGVVFLVSVLIGRPLAQSMALEFWPLTPDMQSRPGVVRLLKRLTILWAAVNFTIGLVTLTLLLVLPLPAFVAVKQPVAWTITLFAIAVTIDRSIRTAHREGFVSDSADQVVPAAA
jgi:hypothetical protein